MGLVVVSGSLGVVGLAVAFLGGGLVVCLRWFVDCVLVVVVGWFVGGDDVVVV